MEKLLELENVSYSYQDGKERNQILDHASYSFEKGKIYAVVGASGSGKTTTLSLASGLDKPDDGKVLFREVKVGNACESMMVVAVKVCERVRKKFIYALI